MTLEPDRDQIEIFTDALFRRAGAGGFVSLRSFYEDDASKPFRITAAAVGKNLQLVNDEAVTSARLAANQPPPRASCSARRSPRSATASRQDRSISSKAWRCPSNAISSRARREGSLSTCWGPLPLWWPREAVGSTRRPGRHTTSFTSIGA